MSARKIDDRLIKLKGELKKSRVMLYLPIDLQKELKKVCAGKDFSVNEVLTELVREYVASAQAESAQKKGEKK